MGKFVNILKMDKECIGECVAAIPFVNTQKPLLRLQIFSTNCDNATPQQNS